jgi:two-component sensor histidine kinase
MRHRRGAIRGSFKTWRNRTADDALLPVRGRAGRAAALTGSQYWRRKASLPVRVYLVAFAVAVAIPILMFAGFLLLRYAEAARADFEQSAARTARQIAQLVDGELSRLLSAVTGLASSSQLATGDLAGFYDEAARYSNGREEVVVLREFEPRQLFNTQLPLGAELPPAVTLSDAEESAYRAGKPYISSVFSNPVSGEPRVAIVLPVRSSGRDLLLAVTIPTTRIRDVLIAAAPQGWIIGIGDRAGQYVTRSERHEEVSGKPAVSQYIAQADSKSGSFVGRGLDGTPVLAGYVRSDFSGWLYAANISLSVVQKPLLDTLMWIGLFGVLSVALSVLLALWLGARFHTQTQALVERATALGNREPPSVPSGSLREFEVIAEAFASADETLRRRSREFEAVLSTVPAAVWFTYDPVVGRVSRNRYAADLMRLPAGNRIALDVTTGLPQNVAMKKGQRRLRPDELPLQRALAGERVADDEYVFEYEDGTFSVVLISAQAIEDSNGAIVGAVSVGLDITERKRGEEQRRLLVNELNHRVKNTLAIVQSIVLQTLRASSNPMEVRDALQSRLIALSSAHDVLNRESWEGAELAAVVAAALDAHAGAGQVHAEGPAVWLPPSFAMSMTLILHELATNAAKYGALSAANGHVRLGWAVQKAGENKLHLTIRWSERDGPPVAQPRRRGFGSRLIARLMAAEQDGSSVIDYAASGVTCILNAVIPTRSIADEGPAGETVKR